MQCTVYSVISKINRNFISRVKNVLQKFSSLQKNDVIFKVVSANFFSNSEKFVKQDLGQTYIPQSSVESQLSSYPYMKRKNLKPKIYSTK